MTRSSELEQTNQYLHDRLISVEAQLGEVEQERDLAVERGTLLQLELDDVHREIATLQGRLDGEIETNEQFAQALNEQTEDLEKKSEIIEKTNNRIEELEKQVNELRVSCEHSRELEERARNGSDEKIQAMEKSLMKSRRMCRELRDRCESLERNEKVCVEGEITPTIHETPEYYEMYQNEAKRRRKLEAELRTIKGCVRVVCRVRPLVEEEQKDKSVWPMNRETVGISNGEEVSNFYCDEVLGEQASQEEMYHQIGSVLDEALEGQKVCVFCYGSTGSGKTFTNDGLLERIGRDLFSSRTRKKAGILSRQISVQLYEIYNDDIIDLLADSRSSDQPGKISIRDTSTGIQLVNLTTLVVESQDELELLLEKGRSKRSWASTACNERSSRSHLLVNIQCQVTRGTNHESSVTRGQLTLCDLAGSERVKKSKVSGTRLTESSHINKSLSALGDVVSALARNDQHVPYRNCKLTFALKDALSARGRATLIVTVSPSSVDANESKRTLLFAQQVRRVEFGNSSASTPIIVRSSSTISKVNKLQSDLMNAIEKGRALQTQLRSSSQLLVECEAEARQAKDRCRELEDKLGKVQLEPRRRPPQQQHKYIQPPTRRTTPKPRALSVMTKSVSEKQTRKFQMGRRASVSCRSTMYAAPSKLSSTAPKSRRQIALEYAEKQRHRVAAARLQRHRF